MQTAQNNDFMVNLYHKSLYDYYVLNRGIKLPNKPPYYSKEFFEEIIEAEREGFDTSSMKVKDWYKLLIKKYVTHQKSQEEYTLKPTRLELINPHIDHVNSFANIRKQGLPSKIMSTLVKLKYDLFLTEERKLYCKLSTSNR